MHRLISGSLLVILFFVGCTAPQVSDDTAFKGQEPYGLLLFSAQEDVKRPVDEDEPGLIRDAAFFQMYFSEIKDKKVYPTNTYYIRHYAEYRIDAEEKENYLIEVKPGTYVLTKVFFQNGTVYPPYVLTTTFQKGAFMFEVKPGKVNYIGDFIFQFLPLKGNRFKMKLKKYSRNEQDALNTLEKYTNIDKSTLYLPEIGQSTYVSRGLIHLITE